MAKKRLKQLNYGYLLQEESEIEKLTINSYKKPLEAIDNAIKFFLEVIDFALKLHEKTKDQELKSYCEYFLNTGNSVLHISRSSKILMLKGYYGSIAVLFRTYLNYLLLAMYVNHHPEDIKKLLKEKGTDFQESKEYRRKFRETEIKKELEKIGHKLPDDDAFKKITHGSVWASQVFGSKTLSMEDDTHELNYSPRYSITQLYVYASLILVMPLDFARYFIDYLMRKSVKDIEKLNKNFLSIEQDVNFAEQAMKTTFELMKNHSNEELEELLK